MNRTQLILKLLLFSIGEVIIIAGFQLIGSSYLETNLLKLHIATTSVVYLANFINLCGLASKDTSFEKKIAGYGIKWFFTSLYSLLAILGIIVGITLVLPFNIQLVYQAIFCLIYLWGISSALFASQHTNNNQEVIDLTQKVRIEIQENLDYASSCLVRMENTEHEQANIRELLMQLNYISSSILPKAIALERQLLTTTSHLRNLCEVAELEKENIQTTINTCFLLLKQRKELPYK